jgi:hypothetical protein
MLLVASSNQQRQRDMYGTRVRMSTRRSSVSGTVGSGGFRALFFFDPEPAPAIIRNHQLHLAVAILKMEPGRR